MGQFDSDGNLQQSKSTITTKIGYSRAEFGKIFQIYSRWVYKGVFRDFSFSDMGGKYYISFREEAGAIPLITIEKRRLGPDRVLFTATARAPQNINRRSHTPYIVARSEKIDHFTEQVHQAIESLVT